MPPNALLYGFAVALLSGWLFFAAGALGVLAGHPLVSNRPHVRPAPASRVVEVELVPEQPAAAPARRGSAGCSLPRCAP